MNVERPRIFSSEVEIPADAEKRDVFESALREMFFAEHPALQKDSKDAREQCARFIGVHQLSSVWVYYPWRNLALRIPDEAVYHQLHTTRNRGVITETEQSAYRSATVGIAGLSVGSAVLASLVATGGPKKMKIADPDTLEITNLNRIRAGLTDIGMNKTDIAAKNSWEVDPFLDLDLWQEGITGDTLQRFMGEPRLDVFIDEMDSIGMKIQARKVCREFRIPVVMATDNGDGVLVDVERFDLEPGRPIFHGRVEINDDELAHIDRAQFVALANKIIDPAMFTPRQWESIQQIGTSLSGVPQLGTAAAIAGAATAYVVRHILIKAPMPSGRYVMSCEQVFTSA